LDLESFKHFRRPTVGNMHEILLNSCIKETKSCEALKEEEKEEEEEEENALFGKSSSSLPSQNSQKRRCIQVKKFKIYLPIEELLTMQRCVLDEVIKHHVSNLGDDVPLFFLQAVPFSSVITQITSDYIF